MTRSAEADSRSESRLPGLRGAPWGRIAVLVLVLGLAFVAARSCQQSQVRVTKEQAIATAERQVDFAPRQTQVRLLRQGLRSHPFWIVSLSIPGARDGAFERLAVVRVDANSGEVEDITQEQQR